jgi:hypothetical protein
MADIEKKLKVIYELINEIAAKTKFPKTHEQEKSLVAI